MNKTFRTLVIGAFIGLISATQAQAVALVCTGITGTPCTLALTAPGAGCNFSVVLGGGAATCADYGNAIAASLNVSGCCSTVWSCADSMGSMCLIANDPNCAPNWSDWGAGGDTCTTVALGECVVGGNCP